MEETNKEQQKLRTGNFQDEDMTAFKYLIKEGANPSEQILNLFAVISLFRMELNTHDPFDKEKLLENKYKVISITITGTAFYILANMEEIREQLIAYFTEYAYGDESELNKIYELSKCKYLIKEYLYTTNYKDPYLFDPNLFYRVHFKDGEYAELHASQFLVNDVLPEINDHYTVRNNFCNILYQFIDLQLETVKMMEIGKGLLEFPENDEKEKELLEVWLALKMAGFLNHLDKENDIANHRKEFFQSFNLKDRHYNDRHNNFKKKKYKKEYLERLAILLEETYSKKINPPNNP